MRKKFTPEAMFDRRVCLDEVSKNLRGELYLVDRERQECEERDCLTLKTVHALKVDVGSHEPCDSRVGRWLDGTLVVRQLVTAFVDGSGERRGTHKGRFRWRGDGLLVEGWLSGLTNAGTHRAPVFEDCQPCDARGYMEGCFKGRVLEAKDPSLQGCRVHGTYRIRFDPSEEGGEGALEGTLEGLLVCPCGTDGDCTDLRRQNEGLHPNPWSLDGHQFHVHDHTGTPEPNAEVVNWGGHTGLNCGYRTNISLAAPTAAVEVTLVHFADPATVRALSGGAVVASGAMGGPGPETIVLAAPAIDTVVISASNNETLLLEICTR